MGGVAFVVSLGVPFLFLQHSRMAWKGARIFASIAKDLLMNWGLRVEVIERCEREPEKEDNQQTEKNGANFEFISVKPLSHGALSVGLLNEFAKV
jgi:hypothetical protein